MTLLELRRKLHNECMDAGGIKAWADSKGVGNSYVGAVINGTMKPGWMILKAMGMRKAFKMKEDKTIKYEYITN